MPSTAVPCGHPIEHRSDGVRNAAAAAPRGFSKSGLYALLVLAIAVLLSAFVLVAYAMKPLVELHKDVQRQRILCRLKRQAVVPLQYQRFLRDRAKFQTCAVVASSGAVLLHSPLGETGLDIDAHDAVFRFNDAPVREFRKWVGKKETVRLMRGPASVETFNHTDRAEFKRHSRLNPNSFFLYLGDRQIDEQTKQVFRKQGVPEDHVMALDLDDMNGIEHVVRGLYSDDWMKKRIQVKQHVNASYYPTTGFVGMLIALSLCDHVDAYDMSPSEASKKLFYHYYIRKGSKLYKARVPRNSSGFVSGDANSWHKMFAAERDLWARASQSSRELISLTGKTSYEGFHKLRCGAGADLDDGLLQL